ncbi:MAG: hypothetical protein RLZZ458_2685 [Planctomycetota bacterium]|jgi:hypothetical protein
MLERRLALLIDFRHGVVHRFALDHGLRKQDIVETLDMIQVLIDVFIDELEKRRGFRIRSTK